LFYVDFINPVDVALIRKEKLGLLGTNEYVTPSNGERIQCPKCVVNKRQDDEYCSEL
jgi:hypothetical protein